jgi:hypothetical protein
MISNLRQRSLPLRLCGSSGVHHLKSLCSRGEIESIPGNKPYNISHGATAGDCNCDTPPLSAPCWGAIAMDHPRSTGAHRTVDTIAGCAVLWPACAGADAPLPRALHAFCSGRARVVRCVCVCVPTQLSPASWERASLYVLAMMCGELVVTIGAGGGGGGGGVSEGGGGGAILSFAFIASPERAMQHIRLD